MYGNINKIFFFENLLMSGRAYRRRLQQKHEESLRIKQEDNDDNDDSEGSEESQESTSKPNLFDLV